MVLNEDLIGKIFCQQYQRGLRTSQKGRGAMLDNVTIFFQKNRETRMHSSRMHTSRSLTLCQSLLPTGVYLVLGVYLVPGGVLSPGGCLTLGGCLTWGVSDPEGCLTQGGVWPRGCLTWGGSDLGGVWSGGCLTRGVCLRHAAPCEQNDRQV